MYVVTRSYVVEGKVNPLSTSFELIGLYEDYWTASEQMRLNFAKVYNNMHEFGGALDCKEIRDISGTGRTGIALTDPSRKCGFYWRLDCVKVSYPDDRKE